MDNPNKMQDLKLAPSIDVAKYAIRTLLKKLAKDVKLIYVRETTVLADYYVVATGRSPNHLRALARDTEDTMALCGIPMRNIEGADGGEWVLVDFGDVILHLFGREAREFYRFERLFDEKNFLSYDDVVAELDKEMSVTTND